MELAPREKPMMISVSWKIMYRAVRPKAPRPTTAKPNTAPPENATSNAAFRPLEALCAVRTLLLVADFIPKKPAAMENSAPTTKHTAVSQPSPAMRRTANITTMNTAKMLY